MATGPASARCSSRCRRTFSSSSTQQLVGAVADLAAASLAQERRLALTFAEARRDALTGLPNRRAFDEQLDRLLEENGDDPVAVALLDVDGFKHVNDTGGHAAGDEVLATLARILLRAVRANEHVFRIGGDEFAVVIAGAAEAGVRAGERILRAARLQRRGREPAHPLRRCRPFGAGSSTKQELLARADAALYQAKDAGRRPDPRRRDRRPSQARRIRRPGDGGPDASRRSRDAPASDPRSSTTTRACSMLLRTTFEIIDIDVEEARSAAEAQKRDRDEPRPT